MALSSTETGSRTRYPVKIGDGLFEVCEPNNLIAKIELSSDDLDDIKSGCEVVLCNGALFDRVHGTVSRIEPKAQLVDDKCVFYADVELSHHTGSLHPA